MSGPIVCEGCGGLGDIVAPRLPSGWTTLDLDPVPTPDSPGGQVTLCGVCYAQVCAWQLPYRLCKDNESDRALLLALHRAIATSAGAGQS